MEKVRASISESLAETLVTTDVELGIFLNANTEREAEQRYLAYKTVVERAVDVFGNELKATRWLSRSSSDFDEKSPLEALADSSFDSTPILNVLGKIEHGVYF